MNFNLGGCVFVKSPCVGWISLKNSKNEINFNPVRNFLSKHNFRTYSNLQVDKEAMENFEKSEKIEYEKVIEKANLKPGWHAIAKAGYVFEKPTQESKKVYKLRSSEELHVIGFENLFAQISSPVNGYIEIFDSKNDNKLLLKAM